MSTLPKIEEEMMLNCEVSHPSEVSEWAAAIRKERLECAGKLRLFVIDDIPGCQCYICEVIRRLEGTDV